MISLHQLLRTSRFLLFILLFLSLFWESCDNTQQQSDTNSTLDTLHSPKALSMINSYLNNKENVDVDFYFEKDTSNSNEKVAFFAMDSSQLAFFLNQLKPLYTTNNASDSARIRIHFALKDKEGNLPKISLLIELISPKLVQSERIFYPLHPNKHKPQEVDIPISNKTAQLLIDEWLNLPADSITNELYLNQDNLSENLRMQYCTFNAQDTYDLYKFLTQNKAQGHFSVFLGKLEKQQDHIPLRTIIRVAGNNGKATLDNEYFEFAAQCPHHCQ